VSLSIIIPTFNESLNIADCLRRTQAANPLAEIIVVDGGTDQTGDIVREFSSTYPLIRYIANRPDLGKGHAIRVGIEAAKNDCIAQLDADLQFHPEELSLLIAPLIEKRADFVMGTRFTAQSTRIPGSTPLLRTLGNKAVSGFVSLLFLRRMTDVLAGVKAWRKEVTNSYTLESNTYSYEVELPIKALLAGWRVIEVPVTTEPRVNGQSSVRVFSVGIRLLKDITSWRLRSLFGAV
jgi:glycosyltransferase involved in cell wall biosynthesis